MKYFIDTEFHEYKKKPFIGSSIDTIELISIGISSEDGRSYYVVCNEFDYKKAWQNEWLRQNVLLPIIFELSMEDDVRTFFDFGNYNNWEGYHNRNGHKNLYKIGKGLIRKYGKSRDRIAKDIVAFVYSTTNDLTKKHSDPVGIHVDKSIDISEPKFYAYYADYDWVVFCWLFGRMIDLPDGFPMYCIDLKQMLDEKFEQVKTEYKENRDREVTSYQDVFIKDVKLHPLFPKQVNEHNALADARWNKELFRFINDQL